MARKEQFLNDAETALNGGINASVTTVTVDDGSVFPSEGDFRVIVNDEVMLVTARSTNDLTVVRGQDGTTAAIQADNSTIRAILSAGAIEKALDDATAGYTDRLPFRILNASGTVLTSSSFTWVNQSTSSVIDDTWGGITMKIPTAAGQSLRILKKSAPTAPYKVTMHLLFGPGYVSGASGSHAGIIARESSTSKLYTVHAEIGDECAFQRWTNETTISTAVGNQVDFMQSSVWLRFEDNNTNVIGYVSSDGINWFQLGSETRTAHMAGAPNEVGFYVNSTSGAADQLTHIQAWIEE